MPFQYAEILAISMVDKCEVGGQQIFVLNSFQITVRRDTKKAFPGRTFRSRNRKRQ